MKCHGREARGMLNVTLIMACLLIFLQGCVIVPLPEHGILWGQGMVDEQELAELQQQARTREEVLLRLGQPSATFYGDHVLVYRWEVSVGMVGIGTTGGDLPKAYYLIIEIGQDNKVLQWNKISAYLPNSPLLSNSKVVEVFKALDEKYRERSAEWRLTLNPVPELWMNLRDAGDGYRNVAVRMGSFFDGRDSPFYGALLDTRWNEERRNIDAEIHLAYAVSDYVRAAVASQLESLGFDVSDNHGTCTIFGTIKEFKADKGAVEIEVVLDLMCPKGSGGARTHRYSVKKTDGNLPRSLEATLRKAIVKLQKEIAGDQELMKVLTAKQLIGDPYRSD